MVKPNPVGAVLGRCHWLHLSGLDASNRPKDRRQLLATESPRRNAAQTLCLRPVHQNRSVERLQAIPKGENTMNNQKITWCLIAFYIAVSFFAGCYPKNSLQWSTDGSTGIYSKNGALFIVDGNTGSLTPI